ncbi:hypothetical protein QMU90_003551 [Edwardsiella ictaluri]|nr:hypothetical protein [Edwardsiella ictaluri]
MENNLLGATSSDKFETVIEKIKNSDKTLGSVGGSVGGKIVTDTAAGIINKTTADITGAIGGSVISGVIEEKTKMHIEQTGKKMRKNSLTKLLIFIGCNIFIFLPSFY